MLEQTSSPSTSIRGFPAMHRVLADPRVAEYDATLGSATSNARSSESSTARAFRRRGAAYEILAASRGSRSSWSAARGDAGRDQRDRDLAAYESRPRAARAGGARGVRAARRAATPISNTIWRAANAARVTPRVDALLREVTGAQDAWSSTTARRRCLLVLDTFAKGREVVVARNQLVEIGGGFRVPDVLERSGASCSRSGRRTGSISTISSARCRRGRRCCCVRIPSNFRIEGFAHDVERASSGRDSARRAGVATLKTSAAARWSISREFGLPASVRCAKRSRTASVSSRSPATSCSAARRPASCLAAPLDRAVARQSAACARCAWRR